MSQINGGKQIKIASVTTDRLVDGAKFLKSDGTVALTADLPAGGHKITGLGLATNATDAVSKQQLDAVSTGLQFKAAVRAASTGANIDLTAGGLLTLDGVTLVAGDRVLVKDQTDQTQNGIYAAAAGAWARTADADGQPAPNSEVLPGMFTFVTEGTTLKDTGWVLAATGTITIGTTALPFVQFGKATDIIAGDGLTKTGTTISVMDGGITDAMLAGGITLDKLADAANILLADGTVAWTAAQNAGGKKLTNLADGVAATDAATKGQLDAAVTPVTTEVTAIETGAGLNSDGTYSPNASANYINTATSLKDADNKLDAQLKIAMDQIANLGPGSGGGGGSGFTGVVVAADAGGSPDTSTTYLVTATPVTGFGSVNPAVGDLLVYDPNSTSWVIGLVQSDVHKRGAVMAFATPPGGYPATAYIATGTTGDDVAGEKYAGWLALDTVALRDAAIAGKADATVVSAILTAAGLNPDGTLQAYTGTNYLNSASSLKAATIALDTQVKANTTAATGAQTEVDAVETAVGLNADGTLAPYTGTNYLNSASSIKAATIALDTAIKTNTTAATGLQTEVDAIETAVGLNADGTFAAFTGTNYLNGATSIKNAEVLLDTQVKTNTTNITANTNEINTIESSVGLAADGTLAAYTGTNYLNSATTIKQATTLLDTAIKSVSSGALTSANIITDTGLAGAADTNIPSTLAIKTYVDNSLAVGVVGFVDDETPSGTIDGTNVTFALVGQANPPESVHLYVNGLRTALASTPTVDGTGTHLTLAEAPQVGDVLSCDYRI